MNVTTDLDTQFRAAAVAEGLVDVRYDVVASPVGDLHVAATGRGLCRISYDGDDWEEQLARGFGVRVLRSPLDDVRRELDEYFDGRRREFDLPLDLRVAPFPRRRPSRARAGAVRPDRHLRQARGPRRAAEGGPCGRHDHEPEPDPDRAAVPPDRRRKRRSHRLCRRSRREATPARARGCNASRR